MQKRNLLAAIISGLLLGLSMPRPGIWPLAWLGLVPMLIAVRGASIRSATLYGLVAGAVYYGIIAHWVSIFGYLPWALVVLCEAALFAIFAAMASCIAGKSRAYLTIPAAWTAIQWARSLGTLGFTWGSFAHTQASCMPVLQLVSIAGPWLIDFAVCLVNVAIAEAILNVGRKRFFATITAAVVTLGAWGVGFATLKTAPEYHPATKVAIIQGNVAQDVVPDLNYLADTYITFSKMSRRAVSSGVGLVIWPETTLPTKITTSDWGGILSDLAKETRATYIIGGYAPSSEPSSPLFCNGAHFYGPDGKALGIYNKARLVPYGEYVPLRDYLPFLSRYGVRKQDVCPGTSHSVIKTALGKAGVSICFESLFPQIARIETKHGANVLVIITNDAWFERSPAAVQHLMMSRLRAVENRRFVIRGAATGISAIIDPYGRTQAELGIFKRGIVSGQVEPLTGLSPYTRAGDWLAYICVVIAIAAICGRLARSKFKLKQ
ncbi:MAG: apolipoprotein N-acyltransferase [Armatimonadota bacterium]|nr:apolipoprotein N-acyltransferase [bacterium]